MTTEISKLALIKQLNAVIHRIEMAEDASDDIAEAVAQAEIAHTLLSEAIAYGKSRIEA